MTRKEKLDTLMLLSALESYCLTSIDGKRSFPDYLIEQIDGIYAALRRDLLNEEASND